MDTLIKLQQYFDQNSAPYEVILHEEVYTSQELAQALHTPGSELVKVVIMKVDGTYRMAVLPASRRIDLEALKKHWNAGVVAIASEQEFKNLFPEAEIGAMPPFGNLYNIEVWVDTSLTTAFFSEAASGGLHRDVGAFDANGIKADLQNCPTFELAQRLSIRHGAADGESIPLTSITRLGKSRRGRETHGRARSLDREVPWRRLF